MDTIVIFGHPGKRYTLEDMVLEKGGTYATPAFYIERTTLGHTGLIKKEASKLNDITHSENIISMELYRQLTLCKLLFDVVFPKGIFVKDYDEVIYLLKKHK